MKKSIAVAIMLLAAAVAQGATNPAPDTTTDTLKFQIVADVYATYPEWFGPALDVVLDQAVKAGTITDNARNTFQRSYASTLDTLVGQGVNNPRERISVIYKGANATQQLILRVATDRVLLQKKFMDQQEYAKKAAEVEALRKVLNWKS